MAPVSKHSESGYRLSLSCLFSHLLISLVISAVLNTYETSGEFTAASQNGEFEYDTSPDDIDDHVSFPPTIWPPWRPTWGYRGPTPPTRATDATPTLQPSTTFKPTPGMTPNPRDPYTKFMTTSLEEDALEYSLDYYSEKVLVKEYDFNPVDLVNKLADSAITHGASTSEFLKEIQDLISLQNRSRTESDENVTREELTPGFSSENLVKRMAEGWKKELQHLEKKYNVSSECTGPDSITAARLALMFPHYINFGQKPFSAPSEISIDIPQDGDYYEVPAFFKRPEFGGVIPSYRSISNKDTRRSMILLHLYLMYQHDQNDAVPFRTKCVMLKRRMEKSVLSDDRRFRFLVNNDIISSDGEFLKTSIKTAINMIPVDFKNKIDWNVLESRDRSRGRGRDIDYYIQNSQN